VSLLHKGEVMELLRQSNDGLHIDPLLDPQEQIGEVSVDLRLGCDFCVSVFTRNPSLELRPSSHEGRGIPTHFQTTRRDIGDSFILYPRQVVLGTTLEYISLPRNIYADISPRSSYLRLGLTTSSHIQPGYRGCASLEMFNNGNIPIELIVGCRLVQARLFRVSGDTDYSSRTRKYHTIVRPTLSKAGDDADLNRLLQVSGRAADGTTTSSTEPAR
jgi:dCTP deaminase